MATLTESASSVRLMPGAGTTAAWIGRVQLMLCIALAVDTLAAVVTTLVFREALRAPAVRVGSCRAPRSCCSS